MLGFCYKELSTVFYLGSSLMCWENLLSNYGQSIFALETLPLLYSELFMKKINDNKHIFLVLKLLWCWLVSRGQTAFFHFYLWWRKKGLVWFTVATRLDTFRVSIEHISIALDL